MLKERVASVCQSRSSFQGERMEQCLMQVQMLLMQDLESENDYTCKKDYKHVKSPSLADSENLHRAQQELKKSLRY